MLSYEQIGAAAMLSRATAGVIGGADRLLAAGLDRAVELAMTKLILPRARPHRRAGRADDGGERRA